MDNEIVTDLNSALPLRQLERMIDRLSISADVKALAMDVARFSCRIGEKVYNIGRKILTVTFDILQRFPNTTFGLVVGVVMGMILASVPLIGALIAPIATPLLVVFGMTRGAWADFQSAQWAEQIRSLESRLQQVVA